MEGVKCRNCGSYFQDRKSKRKCNECQGVRMIDLIPKETKGLVCELYANGATMLDIQEKLSLSYGIVSKIIDSYLGIGEQPILVTFHFN
jgi:DNA-binding MarR family transcriptional regulator